ncbi:MAG TPA: DNA mismatch repair endonuclease MutL, partial [Syntrophales bacterium]|nr:DNA mismatch repair endonuclease MutL [Syntrophales bacterium]
MAARILVLPESLSSKIAAGEVVERPASILKELLENALDAGATDITVLLEKGGRGLIKVIDNGEGIENAEVPLAFLRFATSKIYRFDDIYRVSSYGFRGEALPSIAAVSRVELVTRKASSLSGIRAIVEAGEIKEVSDAGCPVGTSVSVTHIFDPVPVRKKFLKTESTEQGYCTDVITRIALSRPEVRVKLVANGREILNMPACDVHERIVLVLGSDFMDHAVPVKGEKGNIKISGFVSKPDFTRSSGKQLYYFVNRRFVKDYLLGHAVTTAYRRLIEAKKYPLAVLFIDLPPEDLDVNVHPAKMEVRFRNPRDIYDAVAGSLMRALADISPAYAQEAHGSPNTGYTARVEEALKRYTVTSGKGKLLFGNGKDVFTGPGFSSLRMKERREPENISSGVRIERDQEERRNFADLEYMGQFADTYLLFSSTESLILMDQHAAHERILFDKLRRSTQKEAVTVGQRLLIPEVVSLSQAEFAAVVESA